MKRALMILTASASMACGQEYNFIEFAGGFLLPTDVAVNRSNGIAYVADYGHSQIKKIEPDGTVTTFAGSGSVGSADGTGTEAEFSNPVGVAVDPNGNVYVADRGNRTIRKITPDGVVSTLAGNPGNVGGDDGVGMNASFKYIHGVSVDNAGNVFVADREGCTIRRITPGGEVTTIAGVYTVNSYADGTNTEARFNYDSPSGVPVDASGSNVFVMDRGARVIRKITKIGDDWVTTTIAGSPGQQGSLDGIGSEARFNSPYNGVVDSAGNLYVADTGTGGNYGQTIRKLTLDGTNWVVTTIAGTPGIIGAGVGTGSETEFGHDSPFGVTIDNANNLYIADYGLSRVVKGIAPAGPPKITNIQFVSGNVQIAFTSDAADTPDLFALQSSINVGGTYADVAPPATITQEGSGSFRAVTAPSGSVRFYRIKK
jgi:large repetitive protein